LGQAKEEEEKRGKRTTQTTTRYEQRSSNSVFSSKMRLFLYIGTLLLIASQGN